MDHCGYGAAASEEDQISGSGSGIGVAVGCSALQFNNQAARCKSPALFSSRGFPSGSGANRLFLPVRPHCGVVCRGRCLILHEKQRQSPGYDDCHIHWTEPLVLICTLSHRCVGWCVVGTPLWVSRCMGGKEGTGANGQYGVGILCGEQTKYPVLLLEYRVLLAEREGFEPSRRYQRLHDFQSCAFGQLSHLSVSYWKSLKYSSMP